MTCRSIYTTLQPIGVALGHFYRKNRPMFWTQIEKVEEKVFLETVKQ